MRPLLLISLALPLSAGQILTPEEERGKGVFQACRHCHNVLTDARKAGPSLRTLFGKVRLANGKRAIEDNVVQLIAGGYNGMPSYRYVFSEGDWSALISYLKTLRARPEIRPLLKPIRGSDEEVLAAGKKHYMEHCGSCHENPDSTAPALLGIYSREFLSSGEPVNEASLIPRIRDGHAAMVPKKDALDDAALFRLMAFLKTYRGAE